MWGAVPAVVGPLLCFPFHRGRHCHVRGQGTWRSHPARTPHSACAAATLAWKQAIQSPHAILTPTSPTGLARPFSLSDPCQGRVTPSQSVPHQQAGAEPPCLCRASPSPSWRGARGAGQSQIAHGAGSSRGRTPPPAPRGSSPALGGDAGVRAPSLPTSQSGV